MGITYGDHLIDSGANDITPEQEREIEARDECKRRGLDPDDDAADGVQVWMVVDQELRERSTVRCPTDPCICDIVGRTECIHHKRLHISDEMVDHALKAWFASPPSETDQGLERSMRAALKAALGSPK